MARHDSWKLHRRTQHYRTKEAAERRQARNLQKKRARAERRRQAEHLAFLTSIGAVAV